MNACCDAQESKNKTSSWAELRLHWAREWVSIILFTVLGVGYLVVGIIQGLSLYRWWPMPWLALVTLTGPIILNPGILRFSF